MASIFGGRLSFTVGGAGTSGGGTGDVDVSNLVPNTRTISTTAPLSGGGSLASNRTLTIATGTATVKGALQLATVAEATAGTDTTKAVTAAGVAAHVSAKLGDISTVLAAILRA